MRGCNSFLLGLQFNKGQKSAFTEKSGVSVYIKDQKKLMDEMSNQKFLKQLFSIKWTKYQIQSFMNVDNSYTLGGYKNFKTMVLALMTKGYIMGIDLFMLPYDWRVDPDDSQMMPQLEVMLGRISSNGYYAGQKPIVVT